MKSRYLAIVVATAAAAVALSGCAPQANPETVALRYAEAMMTDNGTLPSKLMCEGSQKDASDGARWTTNPATDLKIGEKSEANSSGAQKIEVNYTRGGSADTMVVTVDTQKLCATWIEGGHVSNGTSGSTSSSPTPSATPSSPSGSYDNPFRTTDGGVVLFDDLAAAGEEVSVSIPAGSTFTISGSTPLEVRSKKGVTATQSDIGVEVKVQGEPGDWQSLELWDAGNAVGVYLTVMVE